MRAIVLDTNVLLADPGAIFAFPDAEIIIPETVLGELDKLKTSRVDPDLRFRGREVSRMLFELSEQGSLIEGVELPDGGTLRVAPLDAELDMPEGLSTRNADDRILAVAVQACLSGCDSLTVVTNDLNMLLKAQSFGLQVDRHGDGVEGSFMRRYVIRPFQRYKVPLGILFMSLAVFAAIVVVAIWGMQRTPSESAGIPSEFRQLLSSDQQKALDNLIRLESNPEDENALRSMADYFLDLHDLAEPTDPAAALNFAQQGRRYYDRYLALSPDDHDARTDYAITLFYVGQTDSAIQEVGKVLEVNPDHVRANFNLGTFMWQGRRDYAAAIAQYEKVVRLTESDSNQHEDQQRALALLEQVQQEAESSGVSTSSEGSP
ncbi:MAG: PIN domain-containing protein [Coriobacteriia bacterium]|nr:PIN domain-containing protein [Coriobacteriia bacterium]